MATRILTYERAGITDIHGNDPKRCITLASANKCGYNFSVRTDKKLITGIENHTFQAFDMTTLPQVLTYLHGGSVNQPMNLIGCVLMIRRADNSPRLFCFNLSLVTPMRASATLETYDTNSFFPVGIVVNPGVEFQKMVIMSFIDLHANSLIGLDIDEYNNLNNSFFNLHSDVPISDNLVLNWGTQKLLSPLQSAATSWSTATGYPRFLARWGLELNSTNDQSVCLFDPTKIATFNTSNKHVSKCSEFPIESPFTSRSIGSYNAVPGSSLPSYLAPLCNRENWNYTVEQSYSGSDVFNKLMYVTIPSLYDVACYIARLDMVNNTLYNLYRCGILTFVHKIPFLYRKGSQDNFHVASWHPQYNSTSSPSISIFISNQCDSTPVGVQIGNIGYPGKVHYVSSVNVETTNNNKSNYPMCQRVVAIPFIYIDPMLFI